MFSQRLESWYIHFAVGAIGNFCGSSIKNSGKAKDRPANYIAERDKGRLRTLIRTVCATGGRQLERKHKKTLKKRNEIAQHVKRKLRTGEPQF